MNNVPRVAAVVAIALASWSVALRASASAAPQDGGQAAGIAHGTQVFQRAQLLNIDGATAQAARAKAGGTIGADRGILPGLLQQSLPKLTFDGTQLSQLNSLVATSGPAHITVVSRTLQADAPLTITGQNVTVDFSGAAIEGGAQAPVWLIRVAHGRNVALMNAKISAGTNGILVDSGSNIAIDGNDVSGLTENGIVVTGSSSNLNIHANQLHDLGGAGLMLDGPVTTATLDGNDIHNLLGPSNWAAGIVLTSRGGDIGADPNTLFQPDHHWAVRQPMVQRLQNPTQNAITGNSIRDGMSSGIYNDGAVANVFLDNRLEGNSKEGICFDYGATANVFSGNHVSNNGNRWGQSDADLALDSVLEAGRGPDGTPRAKLPGVSIDNAMYNDVSGNDVVANFGGGVKMVRTAFFNTVRQNTITDNNLGENGDFHFFGVELGAARPDPAVADVDFVPSSGNVVSGNTIHGRHYSGIFVGAGALQNDLADNDIAGAEAFPVETPKA